MEYRAQNAVVGGKSVLVLRHQPGQRHKTVEHSGDVEVGGFPESLKRGEHGFAVNGFYLRARQAFGHGTQLSEVVVVGITAMLADYDTPD